MKKIITNEMIEAGNKIAEELIGASLTVSLGGKENEDTNNSNFDLINKYLNNEIDSVTAIYMAMERASTTNQ